MGVPVVAVTRGEHGTVIGSENGTFEIPAYRPGSPIDTTAAGDAFNRGLIHGLLNGMSLPDAGRLDTITAGLKLRGRGALSGMPTRDEAEAVMEEIIGGN